MHVSLWRVMLFYRALTDVIDISIDCFRIAENVMNVLLATHRSLTQPHLVLVLAKWERKPTEQYAPKYFAKHI